MQLPPQYQWLQKEPGPKMIIEALKELGTVEKPGRENNPKILKWAAELGTGVSNIYRADEIPWCGLFMAIVAKRGGKEVVKDPLWALNWGTFGTYAPIPMLGDVLVFVRRTSTGSTAGHVALYVGEDKTAYHILGGNQSDCVCITRIAKSRLYAARRPHYNLQPSNVRRIMLASTGRISTSEQ